MGIRKADLEFYQNLGKKLANFRETHNIDISEMATAGGVDVEEYKKYESAQEEIPVYVIFGIAKYFNFPPELNRL